MIYLSIIFFIILMFVAPLAMQLRLYEIEPDHFKKIKIKKVKFLFKGIGGKHSIYGDVEKYGIIISLFIVQLLGYVTALLSTILVFILTNKFKYDLEEIVKIMGSILLGELSFDAVIIFIYMFISNRKDKKLGN